MHAPAAATVEVVTGRLGARRCSATGWSSSGVRRRGRRSLPPRRRRRAGAARPALPRPRLGRRRSRCRSSATRGNVGRRGAAPIDRDAGDLRGPCAWLQPHVCRDGRTARPHRRARRRRHRADAGPPVRSVGQLLGLHAAGVGRGAPAVRDARGAGRPRRRGARAGHARVARRRVQPHRRGRRDAADPLASWARRRQRLPPPTPTARTSTTAGAATTSTRPTPTSAAWSSKRSTARRPRHRRVPLRPRLAADPRRRRTGRADHRLGVRPRRHA